MTQTETIAHLTENPSYLKRSASNLSKKYNLKEVTMKRIIKNLSDFKKQYLASLKTPVTTA